jgi:excisionase family DNA binding protein
VEKQLLTPQEAADLLGLSLQAFYQRIHRGQIPIIRIGRSLRVDPEELERWLEGCSTSTRGSHTQTHQHGLPSIGSVLR